MKRTILSLAVALMMLVAIVPASMAQPSDIAPYNGWAGADSPLYSIKLFMEKLDESLAGNSTLKLQKQMIHAEERLCEAEAMALCNNTRAMQAAMNGYAAKLGEINRTMNLPDVDQGQYGAAGQWLQKHQNQFAYRVNSTSDPEARNCWGNAFQYSTSFQNGRPFTVDNGSVSFVPPGQAKNAGNGGPRNAGAPNSAAGNGQANKGAQQLNDYNYSYNYSHDNDQNCTNDLCNNFSRNYSYDYSNNLSNDYNESNLSPGPHQEGHGKN